MNMSDARRPAPQPTGPNGPGPIPANGRVLYATLDAGGYRTEARGAEPERPRGGRRDLDRDLQGRGQQPRLSRLSHRRAGDEGRVRRGRLSAAQRGSAEQAAATGLQGRADEASRAFAVPASDPPGDVRERDGDG